MRNPTLALPYAQNPALFRILPFAAFIALMALEPWLARLVGETADARWLYALRSVVAAGLLVWAWPRLGELHRPRLTASDWLNALLVGLGVLAVWIGFDSGLFVLGRKPDSLPLLTPEGNHDWLPIILRLAGSALVVPLVEEIFWRSFLMRWIETPRFVYLETSRIGWRALLMSSVVFGLEHTQWFAGIVAGLAYGMLYRHSGKLWPAVIAHATTNAGLGLWVLFTGAWHFW